MKISKFIFFDKKYNKKCISNISTILFQNSKSGPIYPVTPEQAELGAFDFDEKVQVLDAIRQNYNFEETFKADYRILKDRGTVDPESPCVEHKLCIRNLKIVNQYAKMRGIVPENLFGKSGYEWLQENITNFDQDQSR